MSKTIESSTVFGKFEEPLTLHMYLYCINDPINKTDPTGQLWGAIRQVYRTVQGIEAYYSTLDTALSATADPGRMLDWLPELNAAREYLFDPETLNKPFAWEIATKEFFSRTFDAVVGACDWKDFGTCLTLGKVQSEIAKRLAIKVLHWAVKGSCVSCLVGNLPGCAVCSLFVGSEVKTLYSFVRDYCGKDRKPGLWD